MNRSWFRGVRLGVPVLLLSLTGCGGCSQKVVNVTPPEEYNNITYVAAAFTDAQSRLGHAPKNVEELKPFLKPFGDPDKLLISPNDGLPFVIRWGLPQSGRGGYPVVAYEQKGKDGKRQVVDTQLSPRKVSEEQFARMNMSTPDEANKSPDKDKGEGGK